MVGALVVLKIISCCTKLFFFIDDASQNEVTHNHSIRTEYASRIVDELLLDRYWDKVDTEICSRVAVDIDSAHNWTSNEATEFCDPVEFLQSIHIVLDTNILIDVHHLSNFVQMYPLCTYLIPRTVMTELTSQNGHAQIDFECGKLHFNNFHFKRIFSGITIKHQTRASVNRVNKVVSPDEKNNKDYNDTLIGYFCKDYQEEFPEHRVYLLTRDAKFIKRCGDTFHVEAGNFNAITNWISDQYNVVRSTKKLDLRIDDTDYSCSDVSNSV